MKKRFIDFLREAEVKSKTRSSLDDLFKAGTNNPPTLNKQNQQQKPQSNTINKASPADTRNIRVDMDDRASGYLDSLGDFRDPSIDDTGYPDAMPVEVTTETLPSVISTAMAETGHQSPKFHQVASLPGNMSTSIRQLGKSLFSKFTKTPTEEIYMVADFGGAGRPNSTMEVKSVLGWLAKTGEPISDTDIDFGAVMPGYKADTKIFRAGGADWMVVKDFMGEYIYTWPTQDSRDFWAKQIEESVLFEYKRDITVSNYGNNLTKVAQEIERNKQITPEQIVASLESIDPTPHKQYMLWLIKQYIAKKFRLEDADRISGVLTQFHELKPRMDQSQRDIGRFDLYSLEDMIDNFLNPDVNYNIDLNLDGLTAGEDYKVLYSGPYGELIQVMTPEASCVLSTGTKWCTTNHETAANYLSDGPLYQYKGKDGRIQIHFESGQIMDVKDRPVDKAIVKQMRNSHPVLKHLFKKYENELIAAAREYIKNKE